MDKLNPITIPNFCYHTRLRLITETSAIYRTNRKHSINVQIHICTECETLLAFDLDLLSEYFEDELKAEQASVVHYWGKTGEWTMYNERHSWFDCEDLVYKHKQKHERLCS